MILPLTRLAVVPADIHIPVVVVHILVHTAAAGDIRKAVVADIVEDIATM